MNKLLSLLVIALALSGCAQGEASADSLLIEQGDESALVGESPSNSSFILTADSFASAGGGASSGTIKGAGFEAVFKGFSVSEGSILFSGEGPIVLSISLTGYNAKFKGVLFGDVSVSQVGTYETFLGPETDESSFPHCYIAQQKQPNQCWSYYDGMPEYAKAYFTLMCRLTTASLKIKDIDLYFA
jgi:hypothetical protein